MRNGSLKISVVQNYTHTFPYLTSYHLSGVFSTGAMSALAPAILGQSITVSTRNSKVLNTPLHLPTPSGHFKDFQ